MPADVLTSFQQEPDGSYTVVLLVVGLPSLDIVAQVKAPSSDAVTKVLTQNKIVMKSKS